MCITVVFLSHASPADTLRAVVFEDDPISAFPCCYVGSSDRERKETQQVFKVPGNGLLCLPPACLKGFSCLTFCLTLGVSKLSQKAGPNDCHPPQSQQMGKAAFVLK